MEKQYYHFLSKAWLTSITICFSALKCQLMVRADVCQLMVTTQTPPKHKGRN